METLRRNKTFFLALLVSVFISYANSVFIVSNSEYKVSAESDISFTPAIISDYLLVNNVEKQTNQLFYARKIQVSNLYLGLLHIDNYTKILFGLNDEREYISPNLLLSLICILRI